MKRTIYILLLVFFSLPFLMSFQSQDFSARGKIQSLFIYNFASKYIEWPSSYKDGSFIIGVLGETPMLKELTTATNGKKAYNQSIEIRKFSSSGEIDKCNMIFIPYDKTGMLQEVVNKLKNSSTIVLTDSEKSQKDGFLKHGAIINFVSVDGKLKFETNKTEIEKREIRIAADLLKLSINTI